MKDYTILLVDDSIEIYHLVQEAFTASNFKIIWIDSIQKSRSLIPSLDFQLAILDVEFPDGSGFDLCPTILKKSKNIPIFFLTAHDQLSEKIMGFSIGADDYITKPFSPMELKARVEAKIRKIEVEKNLKQMLVWDDIQIDIAAQEVLIPHNGSTKRLDLTSLEFKILTLLASSPNKVISRDEILDKVWGNNVHVYPRSVDTHVSKLRKKLDESSKLIDSVHGIGYKFNPTKSDSMNSTY